MKSQYVKESLLSKPSPHIPSDMDAENRQSVRIDARQDNKKLTRERWQVQICENGDR